MSLSQSEKEREREIKKELEKLGLRVYFKLDKINHEYNAWEHTVGFFEVLPQDKYNKVWEVINKHYQNWRKETAGEK